MYIRAVLPFVFLLVPVTAQINHKYIFADEGNYAIHLVNQFNPVETWSVDRGENPPQGHGDLQLIGNNRVMSASRDGGYDVFDLSTGENVHSVRGFGQAYCARRLANGHTMLGLNENPVRMIELDDNDEKVGEFTLSSSTVLRQLMLTAQGSILIGEANKLYEYDSTGALIWEMDISIPNAWMFKAVKLLDGRIVASAGYAAMILVIDPATKTILRQIPETPESAEINPIFYAGFQVLRNGNIVVINWQAHGPGHGEEGVQVLEYDSTGVLVSQWKQDASIISSLAQLLVLDSIDTDRLHDERYGVLARLSGCTNPEALNYDPYVITGDRSCMFSVAGCPDSSYEEYDPDRDVDDSTLCVTLGIDRVGYDFHDNREPVGNHSHFDVKGKNAFIRRGKILFRFPL
jgi:hypothetical protein